MMSEARPVPKLRFPEFRDAGDWETKKIEDIFKITRGNVLSMTLVSERPSSSSPYPVFSSQTKRNGLAGYYSSYLFTDAITWTTDGANAGDVKKRKGKFYCTNVCGVLISEKGYANDFVAEILNTKTKRHVSYVGNPKLMNGVMAKILLPLPSMPEQQKIAECLTSIDDLITAEAQKLDALKTHKKGLMQQLFPCEGEVIPRLRFPEFRDAGDWKTSNIETIASVSSGGTPSRGTPEYWGGDIPWVSTTLIDFNTIAGANEFITKIGLEESSAKIFAKSTILMAMYGQGKTRGKVAMLGIDAAINQACAAISVDEDMNADFVFQNLCSRYDEIRAISNQGGQENLSGAIVKNIPLSYPDKKSNEQQKIAKFLASADDLITTEMQKLNALKTHKKGLMQQLFPTSDEVKV